MKTHELSMQNRIYSEEGEQNWNDLQLKHQRMIQYMQHERLIHLMVTLAFALFLLISLAMTVVKPNLPAVLLIGLFLILIVPYIAHYFFLENTIQRWYSLMDEIEKRIQSINGLEKQ